MVEFVGDNMCDHDENAHTSVRLRCNFGSSSDDTCSVIVVTRRNMTQAKDISFRVLHNHDEDNDNECRYRYFKNDTVPVCTGIHTGTGRGGTRTQILCADTRVDSVPVCSVRPHAVKNCSSRWIFDIAYSEVCFYLPHCIRCRILWSSCC